MQIAEGKRTNGGLRLSKTMKPNFSPWECVYLMDPGEKGKGSSGKPFHYKGTTFHHCIPSFMIQSGDITHWNGR